jgi:hypothetical protein
MSVLAFRGGDSSCSASTTATNSHACEKREFQDQLFAPCCDWLSLRHDYPVEREVRARNGGQVMKISADGEIEWCSPSWEDVRCPSSDTHLRVKCDGRHLWASANIGRFQRSDNVQGYTVLACVDRWASVLDGLGFDLHGFGTRFRPDTVAEWGTHITRVDLAGNFQTSNYADLSQGLMVRRVGQRLPQLGKFGPMWGYDSKRGNWLKAKCYDKSAEQERRRRSSGGATVARLEFQLGAEYLKRHKLDMVSGWMPDENGDDMGKVIYGRFAEPLLREAIGVQDWSALPPKLEHWATLWREGQDLRSRVADGRLSLSQYYRVRSKLLEYGIDIAVPCNVLALTRHVRLVDVMPLENLLPGRAA